MLVLVTSKHKAYRSISYYPHTHIPVRYVSSICCVFVRVSLCTWLLDESSTLIFALIVRQLWKLYRLHKTSPLVWQYQWALNDISTHHSVGHSGICGNDITDELANEGSFHQAVRPELALGVLRPNIKNKTKCRLVNHCSMLWQGLTSTQRP